MNALAQLAPVRQRLRARALLWAMACAAVAGAVTRVVWLAVGIGDGAAWFATAPAVLAAATAAALVLTKARAQWHWLSVADAVEAVHHECANCVRSLVEVELQCLSVTPSAHARLVDVVRERLSRLRPADVVPMRAPVAVALCALAGSLSVISAGPEQVSRSAPPGVEAEFSPMAVTLRVSPPAYLNDRVRELEVESDVQVQEGSWLQLRVATQWPAVWLETSAGHPVPTLAHTVDGMWDTAPFTVASPFLLVVAAGASPGDMRESRVLALQVMRDEIPQVAIVTPARDIVRTSGAVEPLSVKVEASDDHQLVGLELRYVRLAGSGETFTFTEGTVPLVRAEVSPRVWKAEAQWTIGRLDLQRGESVVYRAAVRDNRPGAEWVMSDSYVIDIGTPFDASGAGAALPEEDRRYAISQQMVIVKTERLQAQQATLSAAAGLEQSQLLAAEQRRVRAEVVFLSGGDVADETEEAEHSHELQEGRLENAGRAEMVRAMTEMSRAESALTAGDLRAALRFERAALGALQRAFDRRRYFLRTPKERTRIDQSRRLTGDRRGVTGLTVAAGGDTRPEASALDAVARATAAVRTSDRPTAALVAQLMALGPEDREWRALVDAWTAPRGGAVAEGTTVALLQWLRARQIQLLPPAPEGLPSLAAGAGFTNDARKGARR